MNDFKVMHIYSFHTPDEGEVLMHAFNYPPSAEQLNEYLKEKGWKFTHDMNPQVQQDHDEFVENVKRKHGAEEATKYGKVA